MKVLVTGGTGFVGREIVRQLVVAGHSVQVLARGKRNSLPGIKFIRGSVLDPETLPAAFADAEAIIHLVGIISEVGDQTFDRVHGTGTANAVQAARAASVSRFIHMSALGTRPNAVSRYHRSKWDAEQTVRRSDLRWTIFRPSLIYGPQDGFVTLLSRMSRWSPILPVMGTGAGLMQPISVQDVARGFVEALVQSASIGQSYDLCGPDRLTFTQVLDTIAEVSGRSRWQLKIPLPLARLQAAMLESVLTRILGIPSPLTRDQLIMLQEDNIGDPEPAWRTFGITPIGFREGLKRFLGNSARVAGEPGVTVTSKADSR